MSCFTRVGLGRSDLACLNQICMRGGRCKEKPDKQDLPSRLNDGLGVKGYRVDDFEIAPPTVYAIGPKKTQTAYLGTCRHNHGKAAHINIIIHM